ncbi:MAG: DUF1385 domain-containing protein [Lachnospiraceae bacterium]|nr:DUF1385 domain-containing protein [Lachnospiraceae bacterium]
MKSSGIGGQAVIEGVMMKNQNQYAVAVRTPDQKIEVKLDTYTSFSEKVKLFKLPVFRGVLSFIESLVLGMKTLTYSAGFYEEEEEKAKTQEEKAKQEKKDNVMMGATVVFAVVLAIGIFIVLPFLISGLFGKLITSQILLRVVEGVIRILLFFGYILLISQMKDIKRVFMYHGAEHKTINCIEHGLDLTVANVRKSSKEHRRCGTSFMLIVMVVSAVFFVFINTEILWLRILLRILLIPVIAGVSYEFIRLAGRSDSKLVAVLSKPGLWMQGLTTREPDDEMIEVAIASVEAVFDWRQYLADNGVKKYAKKFGKSDKTGASGKSASTGKPDRRRIPERLRTPQRRIGMAGMVRTVRTERMQGPELSGTDEKMRR